MSAATSSSVPAWPSIVAATAASTTLTRSALVSGAIVNAASAGAGTCQRYAPTPPSSGMTQLGHAAPSSMAATSSTTAQPRPALAPPQRAHTATGRRGASWRSASHARPVVQRGSAAIAAMPGVSTSPAITSVTGRSGAIGASAAYSAPLSTTPHGRASR